MELLFPVNSGTSYEVKIFQQFRGAVAAWLLCSLCNLHAKMQTTRKQKTINYKLYKKKNKTKKIVKKCEWLAWLISLVWWPRAVNFARGK